MTFTYEIVGKHRADQVAIGCNPICLIVRFLTVMTGIQPNNHEIVVQQDYLLRAVNENRPHGERILCRA